MKAVVALLALLLISPLSAESSVPVNELEALKVRMETAALQFLKHSSEAEIEFHYEHRQALNQRKFIQNNRLLGRKIEQLYCYRVIYRKTLDGRLHYEIESRTTINGKLYSQKART